MSRSEFLNMQPSLPRILVTGASGSTGSELIKRLSANRVPVRAMVRRPPVQAYDASSGVEYVTADFEDPVSTRRALDEIERAFLVTNSSERTEAQQLAFVEAARTAGLRRIVYLSQLNATKGSPVRFLRYHAVVEEAISLSGIAFTHLRPNLFMQGFLAFRSSIASKGSFFAPAGDAEVSIVDVRDIAAVAATALTESGHEGKIYDVTGPDALTHMDIAAQLSDVLGRQVTFVDIPESAMREALIAHGFPEWQADGLTEDYAHYRRREASNVSSTVPDVTGRPARSFLTFARDYKEAFLKV
jgi:uncharacterized protein YbjT (DUF2867 family)